MTALIEHSSDAIALVDETGTILYANPATAFMVGVPISTIIGSNVFQWVHTDDLVGFRNNFGKRLQQPGVPIRNAFRLHHHDGSWRNIESVGVNRLDDPGITGIIINYRDVTERHEAEQALLNSELRLRRVIERAGDMIYNCDLNGRFTFVNPTALRLMKYSEQELIGLHFLALIRTDYRERAAQFYQRQLRDAIQSTYFEFPVVAKDGTEVWVGQNVQILSEDGEPAGVTAIARDITARLALENQLRQAQKMEAIGRLAGGVAHDFNNLLTAILASAELLAMQLDQSDPLWEEADAIKRAADRGADLTRRLLAFSRPRHTAQESVDLLSVARSMEPMLRRLVVDTIRIEVKGEGSITVLADQNQIAQIIMNLVVNARDAMPEGGSAIIEVAETDAAAALVSALGIAPGRYARLAVIDSGEGIEPDVQKHLFEPFFTTKPADKGSGLGLSIVYGIATSLGGAIDVWSEPGKGSKFTVYLPVLQPALPAAN